MGVEFSENKPSDYSGPSTNKVGGLSGAIIGLGLAKDEKGAQRIMIVVAIICFILAIFIAF